MYLHIKKIKFLKGGEEILLFDTLLPNLDLFGSIQSAVAEYNKSTDEEITRGDYVDILLAVKKVPDDLCAKHGFRLLKEYNYSFVRAMRER